VGLRGAVPIYLTRIPVLAGLPRGYLLFGLVFVVVVTSLVVQGWTVGLAARVFGFNRSVTGRGNDEYPVAAGTSASTQKGPFGEERHLSWPLSLGKGIEQTLNLLVQSNDLLG
jgi:hypothetical protein